MDANEDVLEVCVLLPNIVGVVGCHHGDAGIGIELDKPLIDGLQLGDTAMLHQLEIVVPKGVPVPLCGCTGLV